MLDAAVPSARPTTGDVAMSAMATDGAGPTRSEMVDGASSPETPVVEASGDPELLATEEPPRSAPTLVSGEGVPVAAAVAPEVLVDAIGARIEVEERAQPSHDLRQMREKGGFDMRDHTG